MKAHLDPVAAPIPFHWGRKVLSIHGDTLVTSEPLFVAVEDDLVLARHVYADAVIDKGLRGMDYGQSVHPATYS